MMACGWTYCSFADDDGFLGGVIVEASNVVEAAIVASMLGINPGGEVLGAPCPSVPPERFRNRLLSLDDLNALDEAMLPGSTN
jgi:hypothetical protein